MQGLKKLSVLAVALAVGVLFAVSASAAIKNVNLPLSHGYWGRAGQYRSTVDSLDGTWVVKANATAASWATPDTIGPAYIGNASFQNGVAGGTAGANDFMRLTLNLLPLTVAADSVYIETDYAVSPNGPWYTGGAAITAVAAVSGATAGVADTTGRGAWIQNPTATYVDPTSAGGWQTVIHGAAFTCMIPIVLPVTTGPAAGPWMFDYVRFRLRGDSSAATASQLYLNGFLTIPVDVVNTVSGR